MNNYDHNSGVEEGIRLEHKKNQEFVDKMLDRYNELKKLYEELVQKYNNVLKTKKGETTK